jgi:hypothetical protein
MTDEAFPLSPEPPHRPLSLDSVSRGGLRSGKTGTTPDFSLALPCFALHVTDSLAPDPSPRNRTPTFGIVRCKTRAPRRAARTGVCVHGQQ